MHVLISAINTSFMCPFCLTFTPRLVQSKRCGMVMCCCITNLSPTFGALYRDLFLVLWERPYLLVWFGPMQHQTSTQDTLSRQLLPLGPPWYLFIHLPLLVYLQVTQVSQCDHLRAVKWFMWMLALSAVTISRGTSPRDQGRSYRAFHAVASEAICYHFWLSVYWPWRAWTLCMKHGKMWKSIIVINS